MWPAELLLVVMYEERKAVKGRNCIINIFGKTHGSAHHTMCKIEHQTIVFLCFCVVWYFLGSILEPLSKLVGSLNCYHNKSVTTFKAKMFAFILKQWSDVLSTITLVRHAQG